MKRQKKKVVFFFLLLVVLITALDYALVGNQSLMATALAVGFSMPIVTFILGLFPALIPIKKLSFLRRWLTYSLLILFVVYCIFLALFTVIILGKLAVLFREQVLG